MDTITEILARPDEAARQIETLGAAVRALTAQLAAVNKTAARIELWIHDTDQFSPRTSAEDMVVQDGQLEELAQIVKALRGDTAPAQSARVKSPMDEPAATVTGKE